MPTTAGFSCWVRSIQYSRTANLRAAATLATAFGFWWQRCRYSVDAAFHGSAHHGSLGKTHQVTLDTAAHFQGPGKNQQVPIDHPFHTHRVAGGQKGVVHSLIRRYGDKLSMTPLQSEAGQRQRKQHDQIWLSFLTASRNLSGSRSSKKASQSLCICASSTAPTVYHYVG